MTQSMAFSPYKKPFEERLMRWEAQLSLVSEVIDEWLALQRAWMYLEPIFSSPDILQQLPQEGKKYSSVDRIWRKVSKLIGGAFGAGGGGCLPVPGQTQASADMRDALKRAFQRCLTH